MDGIEEKSKVDILRWVLVALVVIGTLLLIGGGIFVYQKTISKKSAPISSTPSPQPTEEKEEEEVSSPTPTLEEKKIQRSDLKIKVLNGTGVPGAAGKMALFLEKLGYEGIKTGNADNFDYQKTVIKIKKSKENYLEMIREDLSENYNVEEEAQSLEEEDKFDVIIILGKE